MHGSNCLCLECACRPAQKSVAIGSAELYKADDGQWITINGAHVHLDKDGIADKGPKELVEHHNATDQNAKDAKEIKDDPQKAIAGLQQDKAEADRMSASHLDVWGNAMSPSGSTMSDNARRANSSAHDQAMHASQQHDKAINAIRSGNYREAAGQRRIAFGAINRARDASTRANKAK